MAIIRVFVNLLSLQRGMLGTEENEIEKWTRRDLYFVSCLPYLVLLAR
jgi:hypothetical protein